MVVRYCSTPDCRYYGHPLPADTGQCPACGETRLRLNPDGMAATCPACDELNTHTRDACWHCGATLNHDFRTFG